MVRPFSYAPLLEVAAASNPEHVYVESASAADVAARGGATRFAKPLAVLLLLGVAAGIYSVTKSPSGVAGSQPSDKSHDQSLEHTFYEVEQDSPE